MAAYSGDADMLVGEELEAFLDSFLADEDDKGEDFSAEDDEEISGTQDIFCSCGKSAINRRAKCNLVHYTCGSDGQDRAVGSEMDLCDCCKLMTLLDEDDEPASATPVPQAHPLQPMPAEASSATKETSSDKPKAKRKGPVTRPLVYNEAHANRDCPKYFVDSLHQVKTHPIYGRSSFGRSGVLDLATVVLQKQDTKEYTDFLEYLVKALWKAVSSGGKKLGGAADEMICKELHKLRLDNTIKDLWNDLVGNAGADSRHLLLHVIRQTFTTLVKARNDMDLPPKKSQHKVELGEHDEQVLRYASGYIPFALSKMYMRHNNDRSRALRAFLQTWKVPQDSDTAETGTFLQYTKTWVEKINRGKLFTFNDSIYMFFRAMEIECRRNLTKEAMMCPDLYDQLMNKLDTNIYIPRLWDSLVKDQLPRPYSDHLLQTLKLRFAKMRVTAYVTVYFMLRKMKDAKLSKKSEKSLRKELEK